MSEIKIVEQADGRRLASGPAALVYEGARVTVADGGQEVRGTILAVLKAGDKNGTPWALASFARTLPKQAKAWGDDPQDNVAYWMGR